MYIAVFDNYNLRGEKSEERITSIEQLARVFRGKRSRIRDHTPKLYRARVTVGARSRPEHRYRPVHGSKPTQIG